MKLDLRRGFRITHIINLEQQHHGVVLMYYVVAVHGIDPHIVGDFNRVLNAIASTQPQYVFPAILW